MYLYNLESTLEACTMNNKVTRFIEAERELSQLKHWLKMTYKISIEEFVVLFKVYEGKKLAEKSYAIHYILKCYGIQVKLTSSSAKFTRKN